MMFLLPVSQLVHLQSKMGNLKKSVAVLSYLISNVLGLTAQRIAHDLRASLSPQSSVFLPSNGSSLENTEGVTPRWDVYAPPSYVLAVKPFVIEDVQTIVKYASKNGVPFLATGGGHGYSATLGQLQNGLILDMGNFNTIRIDAKANRMVVGGSVKSADVTAALQAAGREIRMCKSSLLLHLLPNADIVAVGQCTCVGLTGFTLGGGIGPYSGIHGPASDSVSSIEMVTGTGEILTVSESQNPDLFWGMKGAGFNFGAVTSLTYTTHSATNGGRAMNADMTFTSNQNGSIFAIARSYVGKQPKELSISIALNYNPALAEVVIVVNLIYAGSEAAGKAFLTPFLHLQPSNVNITTIPWKDVPSSSLYGATVQGCSVSGVQYVPYSVNLYQIDVGNMIKVVNFMNASMAASPELQTAVVALAQYAPGGFQAKKSDSSAFPYRDVVIFAQIDCFAFDPASVPALSKWGQEVRDLMQKGSGKKDLEVYVHFAHGDESQTGWYTNGKLARLQALKAKYDPHSLFSYYNPVASNTSSYITYG
ncbi:6-hydroxy-D-nicotine oxidase protein [Rutstroemia sp. NJR-2017a BVV2]|nr:6-hydroxy-D-nicotine oxidase protein [Rutstroemia sp. NJR-2017a BVV2]